MATSIELARVASFPTNDDWSIMMQLSQALVKSGLAPDGVRSPEAALVIFQKGRELGIAPLHALANISIIKGKPVANAELMLALIYRDHGDNAIRFTATDNKQCTVAYRRRSWTKPETYSFTLDDAKQAGLLGNQTWSKYPQAMLRARCISAVARMAFADTIGGLYTPEELGATVAVSDEGEIVTVSSSEPLSFPEPVEPRRLTANPPTPRVLTKTRDQYRIDTKAWLADVVSQARGKGLETGDAELALQNDDCTTEQMTRIGDELEAMMNETAEFAQVDDAELWPNGRPA